MQHLSRRAKKIKILSFPYDDLRRIYKQIKLAGSWRSVAPRFYPASPPLYKFKISRRGQFENFIANDLKFRASNDP